MNITLNAEQYTALVALARRGAVAEGTDAILKLEEFLRQTEKQAGVTRFFLWVRWQESKQPLPPTTSFPKTWPPSLQQIIERLDRPIARVDVEAMLKENATSPATVLVTQDPAGQVGWTELDVYFP